MVVAKAREDQDKQEAHDRKMALKEESRTLRRKR